MKKINLFSRLWSSGGNSQSKDVGYDCRLTVGSPSGLESSKVLKFVSVLVLILTIGVGNVWGTDAVLSFTSSSSPNSGQSHSDSQSKSWTITHDSEYKIIETGDNNALHVGSSSKTASYLTAKSSAFSGVTVTSVVVRGKTNGTASASVTINGSAFGGAAQAMNNTATNYTFSGSVAVTGNIVVTLSRASAAKKNIFLYSITVTYTAGAVTYSVTYNANGASSGTVPTDGTSYSSGATVTVKGNTGSLAKTGYTFGGWNTQADGNGTNYTAGSGTFSINANTNLYAKWTANTISLTLNKNNSDASGSANGSASVKYDATSLTSISHATRTGHSIEGYYAEAGCTNKVLTNAGALVNYIGYVTSSKWARATTPTTLYAKWNVNSYLLTWNLNGGTVTEAGTGAAVDATGSPSSSVSYGASITAPTVEKEGYTFTGWNTTPASTMPAAATTYTAQWSINQYTVTWKSNGSTARTDNNVNHGTAQTPPTISPLPCGEKLAGWTDAADGAYVHGTSTLYTTATITITSNKTFYAVFADYVTP